MIAEGWLLQSSEWQNSNEYGGGPEIFMVILKKGKSSAGTITNHCHPELRQVTV